MRKEYSSIIFILLLNCRSAQTVDQRLINSTAETAIKENSETIKEIKKTDNIQRVKELSDKQLTKNSETIEALKLASIAKDNELITCKKSLESCQVSTKRIKDYFYIMIISIILNVVFIGLKLKRLVA